MLIKLGRLEIPGEMPGREETVGGLTLGREIEGRPRSGREPTSRLGLLLIPSEGRETEASRLGRAEGRLLTLGSEGRLEGIEILGREVPPPLEREKLGVERGVPLPGRPLPPIPIDGLSPPGLPRPPRPDVCPWASGTNAKLARPSSRMPSAIGFIRRIMVLTVLSWE